MERLIAINGSGEIPLLLKCDPPMLPCPPDAAWRAKFEAAMSFMKLAQWQETADRLTALAAETPNAPAVWNNLALVRSWLADEAGACAARQKFAGLAVSLEDAVEAEATAMLTSESPLGDNVDIVRWTWPADDADRLHESLLSDRHVVPVPVNASSWPVDDSPPPRMSGMLLDRPALGNDESFRLDNVPSVIGQLLLFGRETDRPARLEIIGIVRPEADMAKSTLRRIAGDTLAAAAGRNAHGEDVGQPSHDCPSLGPTQECAACRGQRPAGQGLPRHALEPLAGPSAGRARRAIVAAGGS